MRKATATKLCANWCGAHEWCGAFYLSLPFQDGGRCHLVDRRESQGEEHVATYGGVGEGHVFYVKKDAVGYEVPLAADLISTAA